MEIRINDKKLDFTIENEKTIGEILSGLDQWLRESGHRFNSLSIDGEAISAKSIQEVFSRGVESIKVLEINTASLADLTALCLINLIDDIDEYEKIPYEDKNFFYTDWKGTPQAVFAQDHLNDVYVLFESTFKNGSIDFSTLKSIAKERLRETETPVVEFDAMEPIISEITLRLKDLPLDIQTGRDSCAAQTIQNFGVITEKLIRILNQLAIQGTVDAENIMGNLNNFSETVNELYDAYGKHDLVLIGDLAEYEIAPKLQELYDIIRMQIKNDSV